MSLPPSTFRISRKNFSLTYPQCSIPKEDAILLIKEILGEDTISYIIVCEELHKDEGKHLHAFVQLKSILNVKSCNKFDLTYDTKRFHCNIQGTASVRDWINYVKKDGCWIEWGTNPISATKLNKEEFNKKILLAENLNELVDKGIINIKELPRVVAAKEQYKLQERRKLRRNLLVKWYYGATGTGKTRQAIEEGMDDYWLSGEKLKWFDGYDGQKVAIIDDLRADSCQWGYLLRLLDIYPVTVEIKGGHANWCPDIIIITAPVMPEELFKNHQTDQVWDKIDQLKRRIHVFRNFDEEPYKEHSELMLSSIHPMEEVEDEIEAELRLARDAREANERNIVLRRKVPFLFGDDAPINDDAHSSDTEITTFITKGNL